MRKSFAVITLLSLCVAVFVPSAAGGHVDDPIIVKGGAPQSQAPQSQAGQTPAETSEPSHHDRTTRPLREMFERGDRPAVARGGRDFEPGKPEPVGNTNPNT